LKVLPPTSALELEMTCHQLVLLFIFLFLLCQVACELRSFQLLHYTPRAWLWRVQKPARSAYQKDSGFDVSASQILPLSYVLHPCKQINRLVFVSPSVPCCLTWTGPFPRGRDLYSPLHPQTPTISEITRVDYTVYECTKPRTHIDPILVISRSEKSTVDSN
jgi:hypothetical protein